MLAALPFGLRVLIVDDNATNRRILLGQVSHFGLQGEAVESAPAALAWLRAQANSPTPCQLVLLDWHMPGMTGLELAMAIRSEPAFARLPLVMLSSAGPLDDPTTAAEVGFAAFLTKPVREAQLHRCLARVLDNPETLATAAAGATAASAEGRGSGLRLLIVEDNLSNQLVARMLFEKMGHSVEVASNGKEGLVRLAQASFDAVIMDCQMPVMDGYEATRRIRTGKEPGIVPWVPVIALTAHALPEDRQKCLNAGMDDYLTKPVRLSAVHEAFLRCGLIKGAAGFQSTRARALRYRRFSPESGAPVPEPMPPTPEASPKGGRELAPIVVVDDDPNDIMLLREGLDEAGIASPIVAFTSGEEAVDFLSKTYLETATFRRPLPRTIFLDIVMRTMNGYQVLTWIRGQEPLRGVKVIMVSSVSTPREMDLSRELGADLHLVKYPRAEVLLQAVVSLPNDAQKS
jgi:CheY-like chemotaxis protein